MSIWTATVFGMLLWGISRVHETTGLLAEQVARAHFDKDQAFRLWATSHGGVYVPKDERTPSNPYLQHVPERDIQTPSGTELTLVNPAYMLRQLHKDFAELYGIEGHLTSLKPLRPENRPDQWEEKALKLFETGAQQVSEYAEMDGKPYIRIIKPMVAAKDCLKCHDNCREGDVRGGVGIALPMKDFLEAQRSEIRTLIVSHSSIFIIGLLGIGLGMRRLGQREQERDQAQAELRTSEKKYRTLFDDSRDGVFISSRKGELVEANKSLIDMFGHTSEEVIGMNVLQFYPNPDEREKLREAIERTGSVKGYEVSFCRKDGTIMHCVLTANVRLTEDGSVAGYQGIVRDVSDRRRSEETLKRQARELERSNADLEQFAFIASHDLKEPLRNVAGCMQLLDKKCKGSLDKDADQLIRYAVESVGKMKSLVQDLLAYSRVNTQGQSFRAVDMQEILDRSMENLRSLIAEKGTKITDDPMPIVMGDPTQLIQLLQNLLGNAVKFSADESSAVHVSARKDGHEWVFSVKDNGIGIQEKYFEKIFVIFQQLSKKGPFQGTGIGLAIVKKIAERHGGRVWVESEVGAGSTFYFTIPDTEA
jgi:PAS domain S-box-containing protein